MPNAQAITTDFPDFSTLEISKIEIELDKLLKTNLEKIELLLKKQDVSWNSLILPLQELEEQLSRFWSPIEQLNATMNSSELRETYNACLPKLTDYHTAVSQNEALYLAIKAISESPEYTSLSSAAKEAINHDLRDFKLAGVNLPSDKKNRFAELQKELAKATTAFEENVLDATKAFSYHTDDESILAGLPNWTLSIAKKNAIEHDQSGWRLTLDFPIYYAIMTQAENRGLRETFYRAYSTKASDQAPDKKHDNSKIMETILSLRQELAELLGFKNYAELSLATKMAETPEEVVHFLLELAKKSRPYAEEEVAALKQFADEHYNAEELAAWDIAYFSEKMQQVCYAISQEELRPYFPEKKVWDGLSEIVTRLYGIEIKAESDFTAWHPDVKLYGLYDSKRGAIGYFYTDLYARSNKRQGAWVGECRNAYLRQDGSWQKPIAFLNCNFTKNEEGVCLMTHDEVVTLFHEFGHTLHHLLSEIEVASVSGFNGVAWDAVELPSQFMENWCWHTETIPLISSHYKTGEPLPSSLLDQLLAAKNFQAGMQMVRQLEFALFDFYLHMNENKQNNINIQAVIDQVRSEVAVIIPPAFNRFQHSFSHIFAGGYAAGYYSYKWAEVLAADAFGTFEETHIFNNSAGEAFKKAILSQGGSKPAMELFKQFRGREPEVEFLLKQTFPKS